MKILDEVRDFQIDWECGIFNYWLDGDYPAVDIYLLDTIGLCDMADRVRKALGLPTFWDPEDENQNFTGWYTFDITLKVIAEQWLTIEPIIRFCPMDYHEELIDAGRWYSVPFIGLNVSKIIDNLTEQIREHYANFTTLEAFIMEGVENEY